MTKKYWPILVLILIWGLFFWKFFLKGLLPIPADITIGMYYPWLDYKWGFSTGVPVKNPLVSDIPSIIYPWRMAVIEAFKSGHWPLWNNAYFLGMPLLANFQSAVLSISNVFFLFLSPALAWGWGIIAQGLFMLLAMFAFLKNKRLSNWASLLGSIVFSFSGFAVAWQQYNVHGWTLAFLPLILLSIDRYFETKTNFWLPLLSLLIGLQIFSGYLPLVIYSWLIIGLSLLFQGRLFSKEIIKLAIFVLLGFGLGAVQLLPGLELVSRSIRKIDPSAILNDVGFLPVKNLITLVIPSFFGNPATGNFWGFGFYDNFANWLGAIPIVLSVFVLLRAKNKKETCSWLVVILLGLVLSVKNPLGLLLAKLFFLEGGIAARAMVLVCFAVAVSAALGLDFALTNFKKARKQLLIVGLAVGLLFLVFAGLLLKDPASLPYQQIAIRNSIVPFASLLAFILLLVFSFLKKNLEFVFKVGCLVLVGFSLWYPANKYWSFTRSELVFPTTPVIDFLTQDKEIFRFEPDQVIPQNMWMPYGLEAVSGYDTLMPKRQGEFISLVKNGKIGDKISRVHLMDNYDLNLFPLLNVKYVLAKKQTEKGEFSPEGTVRKTFEDPRFELVFDDKTVSVFKDTSYLPRIWSVVSVDHYDNDQQLVEAISNPEFDPGLTAAITSDVAIPEQLTEAKIKFLEYQPGRQILEVETSGPAFLVESAAYYPGWQAKLDGQEFDLIEADYNLRGYFIPDAGNHRLEVEFKSASFNWGLKISFLCAGLLLLGLLVSLKKRFKNGS
ncbi:MAG: YfhO family protein [Patescibacteria group bacterium]